MNKARRAKRVRTLTKSFVWECFSFLLTLAVSYAVLGSIRQASQLTAILFVLKVWLLSFYDLVWDRIRWGLIDGDV
jgi:uncharacterized membrane protein